MKVALRVEDVLSLLRMNQKMTPSSVSNIMASNMVSPQAGLSAEVALTDRAQPVSGCWWLQYPAITSLLLS